MTDTTKAPQSIQPIKLKTLAKGQAASFPLTIPLQRLDGVPLELTVTFAAHGKRAWSKIKDEFYGRLRAEAAARVTAAETPAITIEHLDGTTEAVGAITEADDAHTLAGRVSKAIANDVNLVLQIAKGWDLEDPFTTESLEDLEDQFGGALTAMVSAYDRAIYQGQLGN